jgi:GDP-L-fucose synthase
LQQEPATEEHGMPFELASSGPILVTGAGGMVGRALGHRLSGMKLADVVLADRALCDFEDAAAVTDLFARTRPDVVFHLAAKVGGINANRRDPVGFMVSNLKMQINVFEAAARFGVKRQLLMGSSCIYPRQCPQPMQEQYLMTGPLEPTNEAYALAKIVGLRMAEFYHRQHGLLTVCPMPCSIYGAHDSFNLETSHVLSALVRRFCDAHLEQASHVTLWGSGSARREFIHVQDVARALVLLIEQCDSPDIVNLGWGVDITVKALAEMIAQKVGYTGEVRWDTTQPDGTPRKCLDVARMQQFGFEPQIALSQGIDGVIDEYRETQRQGAQVEVC